MEQHARLSRPPFASELRAAGYFSCPKPVQQSARLLALQGKDTAWDECFGLHTVSRALIHNLWRTRQARGGERHPWSRQWDSNPRPAHYECAARYGCKSAHTPVVHTPSRVSLITCAIPLVDTLRITRRVRRSFPLPALPVVGSGSRFSRAETSGAISMGCGAHAVHLSRFGSRHC